MLKVLFVDDEPRILSSLKRLLRGMRSEWEMAFVESGAAALELLAREKFDTIVTDMRMPVMNGDRLLAEVKRLHPRVARIILSGYTEQRLIMKSVTVAHQYLAKPCDINSLIAAVTRMHTLRDMLEDECLLQLLSQMESLPALPPLYTQLLQALEDEESSLEKIGAIVSKDLGLCANILKLVNSAFFSLKRQVASPEEAVRLLGLEIIKALVLSHQIFATFDFSRLPGFSFESLWRHSMTTACYAKEIAQKEGQDKSLISDAFIAGLLHDVGKLALASVLPDKYKEVVSKAKSANRRLWQAEKEVIGTTHAEVGGYLMGLWGMADSIVAALAFHHRPGDWPQEGFCPLTAVYAANILEHEINVIHPDYAKPEFDQDYLAKEMLKNKIPLWRESCLAIGKNGLGLDLAKA